MISRLSIIFLFLCLPILITLTAQRMAETVGPALVPETPIRVKLLPENATAGQEDISGHEGAPGPLDDGDRHDGPAPRTPPPHPAPVPAPHPDNPDAPEMPRQYTPRAVRRILPDAPAGQPGHEAPGRETPGTGQHEHETPNASVQSPQEHGTPGTGQHKPPGAAQRERRTSDAGPQAPHGHEAQAPHKRGTPAPDARSPHEHRSTRAGGSS